MHATDHVTASCGCGEADGEAAPHTGPSSQAPTSPGLSPGAAVWRLHHSPRAPGAARRLATRALERWNVNREVAESVVLVVSELTTNAVQHAQAPLVLHLHRECAGSRIWVGLADGGPAPSTGGWTADRPPGEHGRGLHIVDALSASHGVEHRADGATHWAYVATRP